MVRGQVLLITRTSSVCLGKEKKILIGFPLFILLRFQYCFPPFITKARAPRAEGTLCLVRAYSFVGLFRPFTVERKTAPLNKAYICVFSQLIHISFLAFTSL